MVNMLTTSFLYLFYYYFLILHFKNVLSTFGKISFVQSPFRNCFALFFFLQWIWHTFAIYSQLSLNKHLFKTDNSLVVAPVIVHSFDCNYALYRTETSQGRTTDTFETITGQLENSLGSEKYRKTEMQVH